MNEELLEGFQALIDSNVALVAAVRDLADHIQAKPGRDAAVQAVRDALAKHEAPIAKFNAHMRKFF